VESFARALLLFLVLVLVLTYVNHGPSGLRSWLRVKFLGR
jgi:hypothetical protein